MPRLPRKTTWQPAWKPSKRKGFAASPIDTATRLENQRLETRHVGAAKRAFRARRPPIWSFRHVIKQVGNVTKCHACHAKRHDNLLGNLWKRRGFAASPIDTELTTRRRRDADPTRHSRRTRVQPPDPQTPRLLTGTLRYAFGKNRRLSPTLR